MRSILKERCDLDNCTCPSNLSHSALMVSNTGKAPNQRHSVPSPRTRGDKVCLSHEPNRDSLSNIANMERQKIRYINPPVLTSPPLFHSMLHTKYISFQNRQPSPECSLLFFPKPKTTMPMFFSFFLKRAMNVDPCPLFQSMIE